jgi:hypothetical protein
MRPYGDPSRVVPATKVINEDAWFSRYPLLRLPPRQESAEVAAESPLLEFLVRHRAVRGLRRVEHGLAGVAIALEVHELEFVDRQRGEVAAIGLGGRSRGNERGQCKGAGKWAHAGSWLNPKSAVRTHSRPKS